MHIFHRRRAFGFQSLGLMGIGTALLLAAQAATAADKIEYCAAGSIALGPFSQHIAELRKSNRYAKEEIDKLITDERNGGPEFFSSQVVIKGEQSSSGDFDLNLFHGFSDQQAKYRTTKKWSFLSDDYPVVYFVGLKVREIRGGAIFVSREKGMVNVISLIDKHTKVQDFESRSILCEDISILRPVLRSGAARSMEPAVFLRQEVKRARGDP
jgi:hypothetical protein